MLERFIELDFPIKNVSEESVKEKNIRQGNISTIHVWWARRPLASSRTSIYSSLIPKSSNEEGRKELSNFIVELSKWENADNQKLLSKARSDILDLNGGVPPRVIDPFSGGGAIPLESIRLGCETYANDLNPVAVLIEKCTLYYPQKYRATKNTSNDTFGGVCSYPLLTDINKWVSRIQKECKQELTDLYPQEADGSIPVGYFWARTVLCKNPSCSAQIPLVKHTWLTKKGGKKLAYELVPNGNEINVKIRKDTEIIFDPDKGTVARAKVICPCCNSVLSEKEVQNQFQDGLVSQKMLAVVLYSPKRMGKTYRAATISDINTYKEAEKRLDAKRQELFTKWGIEPIPNEAVPPKESHRAVGSQLPLYGIKTWGDLYNKRQIYSLLIFADKIRQSYRIMQNEGYDKEYAKAIQTYLGIIFDKLAFFVNTLTAWQVNSEATAGAMVRQALGMIWDYLEINPISDSTGSFTSATDWILKAVQNCSVIDSKPAIITQSSATSLPYPDNYFDAVITDPPYYDNVPYSYLSDFFYVWLKRTVGEQYPELFATPLTPKNEEIVVYGNQKGYSSGESFFENKITDAFKEINRILKPEGIACIVFAHKSTEAWEAILNALLSSNLYLTASWPLHTEMSARTNAMQTASLASSIYMVCRKRSISQSAYFSELKPLIEEKIREKLDQFWSEGIGGSDLFISAIGPSMEVFGKYERVEKLSGELVSTSELLEFVRRTVSEYALSKILKNSKMGEIDIETRFYLLWRWTYDSNHVPFDDARLLAQAVGLEISEHWINGFIRKNGENITVLDAKQRDRSFLERGRHGNMIDVLHACLLYWDSNNRQSIHDLLEKSGHLNNEGFWQVAQAISEVLSDGEKEKQMLQGFIYGKESYVDAPETTKSVKSQKSLEGWY